MKVSNNIVSTEEKIEELKTVHREEAVNIGVKEALKEQLSSLQNNVVETLQDEQRLDDIASNRIDSDRMDNELGAKPSLDQSERPTEPVMNDLREQIGFVQDLLHLVNGANLNQAAQEFIKDISQNYRFGETFLDQTRQEMQDMSSDRDGLRQRLDNQEKVFAEERQKVQQNLIQAFAPGIEATAEGLAKEYEASQQQLAKADEQVRQNVSESDAPRLEQQVTELAANVDYFERLQRVVQKAADNQECVSRLSFLEEMRPVLPVRLDADRLPEQLSEANYAGEAYATREKALAAQTAEYERRLTEEHDESHKKVPHLLHVQIKDKEEKTVVEWWEISEHTQLQKEGHSEQKMASRIDWDVMRDQGYSLDLVGELPPCERKRGCDDVLHHFAEKYNVGITYTDEPNGNIYAYGPAYEDEEI